MMGFWCDPIFKYDSFFQVWPSFPRVTCFSKYDPIFLKYDQCYFVDKCDI